MSRPRLFDPGFLRYLRTLPCCCGCNRAAPSEAAHIRIGFFTMSKKPDDCNAVPLSSWCHRLAPNSQHQNERTFWEIRRIDPFAIAAKLYAEYGGDGGRPRLPKKLKPRKPPAQRTKIRQGKTIWPQKPFASATRKF
jgi:hypothetical protein